MPWLCVNAAAASLGDFRMSARLESGARSRRTGVGGQTGVAFVSVCVLGSGRCVGRVGRGCLCMRLVFDVHHPASAHSDSAGL